MEAVRRREPETAPLASLASRRRYHEGVGGVIVREDGEVDPSDVAEMSSTVTFEGDELGTLPLAAVFERYLAAAGEIGEQKDRFMIESLEGVTRKTGNVIEGKGRGFDPEIVLEALSRVQVDISPDGTPIWPTFVIAPSAGPQMTSVLEALEKPPYRKRMEDLVTLKRREWHDRESRRKLVD